MEENKKAVFSSSLPWNSHSAETLVILCSDNRFQPHFDQFLKEGLKVDSFARLALPGGPQFLLAGDLPMFEKAGRRWVKFLTRQFNVRQIICLAHEDCLWYKEITVGPLAISLLKDRQMSDLRRVRLVLQEMFPKIAVRMFYADVREDNKAPLVEFTEVH